MRKNKNIWHLQDVILITMVAVICGVICWGSTFIYDTVDTILTPLGLHPIVYNLFFALYILAGPLAGIIFKRPCAAFLGN